MLIVIGKYKSKFDFPEHEQIINEMLNIIKGKTRSPLGVFEQLEKLALEKMNKPDDEIIPD
jgi:hypothetical protein